MTSQLTPYVITLPTGRTVTVEADTQDNARAAAAIWMDLVALPEGTLVVNAEARP